MCGPVKKAEKSLELLFEEITCEEELARAKEARANFWKQGSVGSGRKVTERAEAEESERRRNRGKQRGDEATRSGLLQNQTKSGKQHFVDGSARLRRTENTSKPGLRDWEAETWRKAKEEDDLEREISEMEARDREEEERERLYREKKAKEKVAARAKEAERAAKADEQLKRFEREAEAREQAKEEDEFERMIKEIEARDREEQKRERVYQKKRAKELKRQECEAEAP